MRSVAVSELGDEILGVHYGLLHADRIVVQSRKQQGMLRDGFGMESTVLPMHCPGPSSTEYRVPEPPRYDSCRILWVGRICPEKCPERLLELAQLCSELHFDVVGPADGSEYAKEICNRIRTLPNLTLHGIERTFGLVKENRYRMEQSNFYRGIDNVTIPADEHDIVLTQDHGCPVKVS